MEKYERNRILRNFILKVIIVILLALLLIWLVPKIISKNNKGKSVFSTNQNEIFKKNLNDMKKAGIKYFTIDKVPQSVGGVKSLTLKEMYEQNLIDTLTDSKGKKCDSDKSYIEVTRENKGYLMKVNLYCNKKEDNILTRINPSSNTTNNSTSDKTNTNTNTTTNETRTNSTNSSNSYVSGQNKTTTSYKKIIIKKTIPGEPKPSKNYSYEYVKITIQKVSNYSGWSNWIKYTDNDNITPITCNENDLNCSKEVKVKEEQEQGQVVKYYSIRTRTFVDKELKSYEWSGWNNIDLLNAGYHYTGNWKEYYS